MYTLPKLKRGNKREREAQGKRAKDTQQLMFPSRSRKCTLNIIKQNVCRGGLPGFNDNARLGLIDLLEHDPDLPLVLLRMLTRKEREQCEKSIATF